MTRRLLPIGLATVVCLSAGYWAYAANALSKAVLTTATGAHELSVEIADTPETRETGLMNRESMPADQGMLFDFGETRDVAMWMKNTLIPLDMLFLDEAGRVSRVATNAQPLSLAVIPSGGPVRYVLELNGGAAARLGVRAGDALDHPIIGN